METACGRQEEGRTGGFACGREAGRAGGWGAGHCIVLPAADGRASPGRRSFPVPRFMEGHLPPSAAGGRGGREGGQNAVNRKERREGIEGPPNASLPNALAASPFVPIASSPPYPLLASLSPPYPLQIASSSHPHPLLIVSPFLLIPSPLPLLPRLGRPPRPHVTHSSLAGLA